VCESKNRLQTEAYLHNSAMFLGTSLMSMGLAPLAGPATVNNMAGNTLASSTQVFGTSAGTWATSGLMASGAVGTVFSVSNMAEAGTGYNPAKEIMFQGDDKTYREHSQIVNSINVNTDSLHRMLLLIRLNKQTPQKQVLENVVLKIRSEYN